MYNRWLRGVGAGKRDVGGEADGRVRCDFCCVVLAETLKMPNGWI